MTFQKAERFRQAAPLLIASLVVVYALFSSPVIPNFVRAFSFEPLGYGARMDRFAFGGVPMNGLVAHLNALLPQEEGLTLRGRLASSDFLRQRMAEALYPRRLDDSASWALALYSPAQMAASNPASASLNLLQFSDGALLLLEPNPGKEAASPVSALSTLKLREDVAVAEHGFSVLRFLAAVLAVFGFGALGRGFFKKQFVGAEIPLGLAVQFLAGASTLALVVTIATWFQFALSWPVLTGIGIVALLAQIVLARKSIIQVLSARFPRWSPEAYAFGGLLVAFGLRMALFPISLWDGRSIWMFHAKKIFHSGMFSLNDMHNPEYLFSHPIYPLLVPSLLAFFTGLESIFNERMAALALPLLFTTLLGLIWFLARRLLGRALGALFVLLLFFAFENLVSGGYVDGFVVLALLVVVLTWLESGKASGLGLLGLLLASLVKIEGLVFGALLVGWLAIIASPEKLGFFKSESPKEASPEKLGLTRCLRRALPGWLVLLPAIFHQLWLRWNDVRSLYGNAEHDFSEVISRYSEFFSLLPEYFSSTHYLQIDFFMHQGILAWVAAAILVGTLALCDRRTKGQHDSRLRGLHILFYLSTFFFAFQTLIMVLMPYEVGFAIGSLDRYSMLGSVFSILCVFVATRKLEYSSPGLRGAF